MDRYDVVIIGAGAAGLMCAYILGASEAKLNIAILEHNSEPGKKLFATGNGRCNYANDVIDEESFRGTHPDFAYNIINRFDKSFIIHMMESMGIKSTAINGYYYPRSLQAKTVVSCLCSKIYESGAKILCNTDVTDVEPVDNSYIIKTSNGDIIAEKVVIATGGKSSPVFGSDGSGYGLAKKLGHKVTDLYPSLNALEVTGIDNKLTHGVRAKGSVKILANSKVLSESAGEIQFTSYGISGIPVFQVSGYAAKALATFDKVYAEINLIPEYDAATIEEDIMRYIDNNHYKSILEAFNAFVHEKLVSAILKKNDIQIGIKYSKINSDMIRLIVNDLKCLRLKVVKPLGFDDSQVTAGGVDTDEIDNNSMESVFHNGLYFIGEILDIDGNCGGYNLHFAFAGAAACADHIIDSYKW